MGDYAGANSAAAPWREAFLKHIDTMSSPTFTLATNRPASAPGAETGMAGGPRARTCVFRGLWTELPNNDKNKADKNPHAYESDLPVFTTDVRMDKMAELLGPSQPVGATPSDSKNGPPSGGGGAVEAVFWPAESGTQWRIRGTAWVLGPDVDSDGSGAHAVRKTLLTRMRRADGETGASDDWSWQREVTAHFGNLSPMMRGSFRNPSPGRPVAAGRGEGEGLGQRVDGVDDELARRNFRVVVIVPLEVDQADLSDPEKPRRWLYTYRGSKAGAVATQPGGEILGEWEKVEIWP